DTFAQGGKLASLESFAVVADLKLQRALVAVGPDENRTACFARLDAVTHGVFDQRLKNKCRHKHIQRSGLDLLFNSEPFTEPGLLYFQIQIENFNFPAQRYFVFLRRIESDAEKITKRTNHVLGRVGLPMHERGDRVERIEKEMGLELRL